MCIEVLVVLHVWASSGSSPEACGHSALLYVGHKCMYRIFQGQNSERHSLYIGILGLNISKCFTGKDYGLVVLEECSAEAKFTGIGLQKKELCVVIISPSGPEKHAANPGLQVVKCLICGGVLVPICYLLPEDDSLRCKAWEKGLK